MLTNNRVVENKKLDKKGTTPIEIIFSGYVALIPILQYYKSPVSFFNMATFLALIFLPVLLIFSRGKIKICKKFSVPLLYVLFITINILVTSSLYMYSITDNIMTYFRMMLLVTSIIFIGSGYFNLEYAMNTLKIILVASALFMIVQLAFIYVFHHPITGNIPALVTNEGYKIAKERPSGFYMEPAAYAQSALLYICFVIFGDTKRIKEKLKPVIIIVLGILMSGSGQGYAFLALVFIIWLLYNFFFVKMNKDKIFKGIVIILLLILVTYVVLQTPYGQYALSRVFNDEGASFFESFGGSALSGRTYTNKLFGELPNLQKIWGVGFGRSETVVGQYYVNSLFWYLFECGYLSISIWLIMLIYIFLRGDTRVRVFTIIYTILFYFSGCGRPMMLCFYFSFLLIDDKQRYIRE